MYSSIILIGPVGAGKSTQGDLLAQKLNWPRCALDDLRWNYYKEIGYDEVLAKSLMEEEGFVSLTRYWKPFEVHAVERILADNLGRECVIDFGAGHSVYEDESLFHRVQSALESYHNVVLLLPCADLGESIQLLRVGKWDGFDAKQATFDFHEHFVKHPSNHLLAKFVVYTKHKTPEQTRDEIIRTLGILIPVNSQNQTST